MRDEGNYTYGLSVLVRIRIRTSAFALVPHWVRIPQWQLILVPQSVLQWLLILRSHIVEDQQLVLIQLSAGNLRCKL
jgi:hypothetical protein